MKRRLALLIAPLGAVLVLPAVAAAQPYLAAGPSIQQQVSARPVSPTVSALPFTGFEIGALVALAVLILGLGLVLRRLQRAASADR